MGYQPPLRSAVIFLMGLNAGAVSPRTIAEMADVSKDRAKAFVTILENCDILQAADDGWWEKGKKWMEWIGRPCRTRPQTATSFDFIAESGKMRKNFMVRVQELMEEMGLNPNQLARKAGIHNSYLYHLQRGRFPPVPQTVCIARALGKSVEELMI